MIANNSLTFVVQSISGQLVTDSSTLGTVITSKRVDSNRSCLNIRREFTGSQSNLAAAIQRFSANRTMFKIILISYSLIIFSALIVISNGLNKYSKEANIKQTDKPFRMMKLNELWSKAVKVRTIALTTDHYRLV